MNDIQALAARPDYEGIVERVGGRPLTAVIDERIRDEFLVIDMAFLRAAEATGHGPGMAKTAHAAPPTLRPAYQSRPVKTTASAITV